jgi:nucleoside-diphosphate-sugar epimerase
MKRPPTPPGSPGEKKLPETFDPSRYIERVNLRTGKEIGGEIAPDELLVHAHRDKHVFEVGTQFLASRLVRLTGNEGNVRKGVRALNSLGAAFAETLGSLAGSARAERATRSLMGVQDSEMGFRFKERTHLSEAQVALRVARLQKTAKAALRSLGARQRFHVLLTGGTGFLGKEILAQAAGDPRIEAVVAVVRKEALKDPKTQEVVRVLSAAERGALLLKRLGIRNAEKFRFVEGDVEKEDLGIGEEELQRLRGTLTHVIHCAASVAFDDTYVNSYRANVLGALNALEFSLGIQKARGSRFVLHVAIETSYIHGRKKASIAQEHALTFPRHFYNNFYELTKALASIETDKAMVDRGLRVAQLLPSIVIGDSRTGNNRGDTKVVNAPINAFGRSKEAAEKQQAQLLGRYRALILVSLASGFPGDPSAELNLVPVDRVAAGILSALSVPRAIGTRVHLATDNRIRSEDMLRIVREELGVRVHLTDPTLYRNLTLPLLRTALVAMKEPKLANALGKLGTIFGGYGEWGQPVHEVGNDVRILGLSLERPNTQHAFRMLCRHNRFVQEFGKVRDPDEIGRREAVWAKVLAAIELETGRRAASIGPAEFLTLLTEKIEVKTFRARRRPARGRAQA